MALSHQVVELANAVQGIQAFLARSLPSATQNTNENVRASVVNPLLPRVMPTAKCPREDLDTLSLAASDSLVTDEQNCYLPLEETCSVHSHSQHSHSNEGSGLQGAGSSVAFSLQDTIKMALAKLNLDHPLQRWDLQTSCVGQLLGRMISWYLAALTLLRLFFQLFALILLPDQIEWHAH